MSNIWVARQTAPALPKSSVLHFAIRNSLRSWNFCDLAADIPCYSNTGGFGIDGCLSSTVGAAISNPDKIYYCVIGDLAFFYDMNVLGNRHLPSNIRILLINNGTGMEMKLYSSPVSLSLQDEGDSYLRAKGHYAKKSTNLVKHYAEDLGLEYHAIKTKDEYLQLLPRFVQQDQLSVPMFIEVFIDENDENTALKAVRSLITVPKSISEQAKGTLKDILGANNIVRMKKILGK